MMRAKADPKAAPNTVYGLACVLLLGALFGFFAPPPKPTTHKMDSRKSMESTERAQTDLRVAQSAVATRTWAGEDASITGGILSLTTALARKRNVNFVRLTPQREILGGPLEQLPFLLVIEGPFPSVAALEKDLEIPANRLAVSAIQLASSDSETNKVTANITLVAHRVAANVGTTETKNGKGS